MEQIVLVGGGGHATSVADALNGSKDYRLIGYTDIEDKGISIPYLGTDEDLPQLFINGCHYAAVGIGYIGGHSPREEVYALLKSIGFHLPPIVDDSAVVSKLAILEDGVFVGKNAVVNTNSHIGKMSIINTAAIIEHGNQIGEFTHVAVGATLCGDVVIGNGCLIGANATIVQGVSIGMNSIVGAGSIVLSDVPDKSKVIGIWK